jgi:amidase
MTPLALGTQTGGSTIRPAAYCGVVGYKPSFNLINRAGVKPLAESQDTVGLMARSVRDVTLLNSVLSGCPLPDFDNASPPRIGVARMAWPTTVEPAVTSAMEDAAARLTRAGARLREVDLPSPFEASFRAHRTMNDYEAWRALAWERRNRVELLSPSMRARLTEGAACTFEDYREAQSVIARCRAALGSLFGTCDVLVTPSVPAEAPVGLENTGDSTFIRIWTAFHTPSVNLPVFRGAHGLPLGLQVIGPVDGDQRTLACSEWMFRTLTG